MRSLSHSSSLIQTSSSRKYERIGLSLSIAKEYIRMHGGYISVDSVVDEGSTFTIHIPKIPHEDVTTPESFDMWL